MIQAKLLLSLFLLFNIFMARDRTSQKTVPKENKVWKKIFSLVLLRNWLNFFSKYLGQNYLNLKHYDGVKIKPNFCENQLKSF